MLFILMTFYKEQWLTVYRFTDKHRNAVSMSMDLLSVTYIRRGRETETS